MILLNVGVVLFFGYVLATKDYSEKPKWMYYMDGFVFAVNLAIVGLHLTNMLEI